MSPSPTVSAGETSRSLRRRRVLEAAHFFPSRDRAARNALDVVTSGSPPAPYLWRLRLVWPQTQVRQGLPLLVHALRAHRPPPCRARPQPRRPCRAVREPSARLALADSRHPSQRVHVSIGEGLPKRGRVIDRQRGQRRSSGRPRNPSKVRNRSRASASANPYSVCESSRTIIAVMSRDSVPDAGWRA